MVCLVKFTLSFTFTPHKSSPGFLSSWSATHEKLEAKGQAVEKSEGKNLHHLEAGGLDANQLKVAYKHIGRMVVGEECSGPPSVRDGAMTMTIRKPLPRSYGVCC